MLGYEASTTQGPVVVCLGAGGETGIYFLASVSFRPRRVEFTFAIGNGKNAGRRGVSKILK